jgi:hypothetical protein
MARRKKNNTLCTRSQSNPERLRLSPEYEKRLETIDEASRECYLTLEEISAHAAKLAKEICDQEDAEAVVEEVEKDDTMVYCIEDARNSARVRAVDADIGIEDLDGAASHTECNG